MQNVENDTCAPDKKKNTGIEIFRNEEEVALKCDQFLRYTPMTTCSTLLLRRPPQLIRPTQLFNAIHHYYSGHRAIISLEQDRLCNRVDSLATPSCT